MSLLEQAQVMDLPQAQGQATIPQAQELATASTTQLATRQECLTGITPP